MVLTAGLVLRKLKEMLVAAAVAVKVFVYFWNPKEPEFVSVSRVFPPAVTLNAFELLLPLESQNVRSYDKPAVVAIFWVMVP